MKRLPVTSEALRGVPSLAMVPHRKYFELSFILVHVTYWLKYPQVQGTMLTLGVGGRRGRPREYCTDNYVCM